MAILERMFILFVLIIIVLAFLFLKGFNLSSKEEMINSDKHQKLKRFKKSNPHIVHTKTLQNCDNLPSTKLDYFQKVLDVEKNYEWIQQTNPDLISYVRARYIIKPPENLIPYKFKNRNNTFGNNVTFGKWVRTLYKNKRNGVFLELGANDGESMSHTLDLEMNLGWSGLLIECNPEVVPDLRKLGRKAWLAMVCVSNTTHPQTRELNVPLKWSNVARFGPPWDLSQVGHNSTWTKMKVETVPLYTILASVGIHEVDYFRLDIQGEELAVLKTFQFRKIIIKVLIVHVYFYTMKERRELKTLLDLNGLIFIKTVGYDEIYIHESLLESTNSEVSMDELDFII